MQLGTGLAVGLAAEVELTVTDADTAPAFGSGDVPVLATPRILALMEAATVAATAGQLPSDTTSVGTHVELDHLAPAPVGRRVVAQARLVAVDGRLLTFEVSVRDPSWPAERPLARGRVERVVVDRARFLGKLDEPGT